MERGLGLRPPQHAALPAAGANSAIGPRYVRSAFAPTLRRKEKIAWAVANYFEALSVTISVTWAYHAALCYRSDDLWRAWKITVKKRNERAGYGHD